VERGLVQFSIVKILSSSRQIIFTIPQPVIAFLVNWTRAKGCLRASEAFLVTFFAKKVTAPAAGAVRKNP